MSNHSNFEAILVLIIIICVLIFSIGSCSIRNGNEDSIIITVQSKDIKNYKNSSKYLIWTEAEVFENCDSWVYGKFNSSDIFGRLKVGNTYRVKVVGKRIPFLSWYRNIIEIEEREINN
jgi:hypothetical protein